MRAQPCQAQAIRIRLAVDQQQVGLDVGSPVARPAAGKVVIAVSRIEWLIARQRAPNPLEIVIKRVAVPLFGLVLLVVRERGSAIHPRASRSAPPQHRGRNA